VSIHMLNTDYEPSEVTLSFYEYLEGSELELKLNMLYNASCMLAVASNLQAVSFAYNKRKICLKRTHLEEWYDCALTNELTEMDIMKKIKALVVAGNELPL